MPQETYQKHDDHYLTQQRNAHASTPTCQLRVFAVGVDSVPCLLPYSGVPAGGEMSSTEGILKREWMSCEIERVIYDGFAGKYVLGLND